MSGWVVLLGSPVPASWRYRQGMFAVGRHLELFSCFDDQSLTLQASGGGFDVRLLLFLCPWALLFNLF